MAKKKARRSEVPTTPREAHWRAVSRAWEKSGLTQAEFCRKRGHSFPAFHHWRGEIRRRDLLGQVGGRKKSRQKASPPGNPGFTEVRVVPAFGMPSWPVEIVLSDGKAIRVARDADSETLRKGFRCRCAYRNGVVSGGRLQKA
jgi:hypothetical protein